MDKNKGFKESIKNSLKQLNNPHAVMLGSNMYIGNDGLIKYEINGSYKDFFRVREIYHSRKSGSHLAVDVDIKDSNGKREIKLAKSNPVVIPKDVKVNSKKLSTEAYREDKSLIIKIEQLQSNNSTLPSDGPVRMALDVGVIQSVVRITGTFLVGNHLFKIDNNVLSVNDGAKLKGNLKITQKGDFLGLHESGGLSF